MGTLVLSRKVGQSILIGEDIEIVVTEIGSGRVKLAIRSPRSIPIYRQELYEKIKEENRRAALVDNADLLRLAPLIGKGSVKDQEPSNTTETKK
ncbi:carbon storage regulator CsrA [Thermodesulforhabdus norvegica]|uniref:Translational regulator CsrA n=1 Tax=Thermodesulforhabdus norvegica TaxID=39841 RepID=A0A1I4W2H0_9BACT|nr:carbon storage regulator CsrA [Thermodesulforhabdus norvegica]SFN07436.1 carbon storage regulator, CsrA [Thermodesulforhabdus norvegica]